MMQQAPLSLNIQNQLSQILEELIEAGSIRQHQIIVFGVSTSEVQGKKIGTSGAEEVAEQIYKAVMKKRSKVNFFPAFQCCEHLNRALVVERDVLEYYPLEEVSAVPIPRAGGSMAAFAYHHLHHPCLVEEIQAHAGIDIGDTLIGMHLRKVAVPVRPSVGTLGQAHVTMAYTRPKLIGGERTIYQLDSHIIGNCN